MSFQPCRRRFERVPVETKVFLKTPLVADETDVVRSQQLSRGGCLLTGERYQGVGRILTIDLAVERAPIRAIGKVVYEYRDREGAICSGVSFEYIDERQEERLAHFVEHHLAGRAAIA